MPLETDVQRLNPGALVELYVLDPSPIDPLASLIRLHNFVSRADAPVVFQGNTYTPFPIEAIGFGLTSTGQLPRPRVRVANLNGMLQSALQQYDDLVGAIVIRKRTFEQYLDGEPGADPLAELPEDHYLIERKVSETRNVIEWELVTRSDAEGAMLPRRQVTANACAWRYMGEGCGWVPSANPTRWYNALDGHVFVQSEDRCGKRLASCRVRHGAVGDLHVPFGGFPGSARIAR